jgi:reactive intermediate/imine deaminase
MGTPVFSMVEGAALLVAPYSHFVEVDGWVFPTGQFGMTPEDESAPIPGNIEDETHRTMHNLGIVLEASALGFEYVVSARVFLVNFERDYAPANAVDETYFAPGRRPVRTCVGVTALARGAVVEIDFISRRP